MCNCSRVHNCRIAPCFGVGYERMSWYEPTVTVRGKLMGAILELTQYAATPFGMVVVIALGAAAYFAARWVLVD
jgi:hypothetical protein